MATYKEIHGVKVQYRDSDATATVGDVWYNSNTGLLKMYAGIGAVASSNNLNTARSTFSGCGIQTNGMVFAGDEPPRSDSTETYDGSSWTTVADLNTAMAQRMGDGTTTAGLCFGGGPPETDDSEEYNGTSWTEGDNLNTARRKGAAFGIQTACVCAGGMTPPKVASVEEYNGSSWTEVTDIPTATNGLDGAGILTDGIVFAGGGTGVGGDEAYDYDGTNWTTAGVMNDARTELTGWGLTGATGVAAGGTDGPTAGLQVELYNGTAWSEETDLLVSRLSSAAFGAQSAGVVAGGSGYLATTEEWSLTGASVETVAFD